MVQVRVAGVALDAEGQHVILLKPLQDVDVAHPSRLLPVWIGAQEATSILIAVEGAPTPRPLAHDLMRTMLDSLDAEVSRVDVTRLEEGTYYAEITVTADGTTRLIDARPSDAVALASRTSAPIFVADDIIREAGIPDMLGEEDVEVEEFKEFLEDVDPEDFRG